MGAKDSKPSCITYEEAVKRSKNKLILILISQCSTIDIAIKTIVSNLTSCILVSDLELKRLREAFKRLSPVNGAITKHSFIKEVLGDGVPLSIADVWFLNFYIGIL